MKDVAALAGVSYRTVSNVINGHRYISDATRVSVEAAIAELGYRPQQAARQLRSGRSMLLTLSVPFVSHPYFAQLAHAVVTEAERVGYDVVIDETRGLVERELRVAGGFRTLLTDGIIFSPLSIDVDQIVAAQSATPLVLLGERPRDARVDSVVVNSVTSSAAATRHLIDAGCRAPGFLGAVSPGVVGAPPADLRLGGYQRALDEAGFTVRPEHVIAVSQWDVTGPDGVYTRQEGYDRMREVLACPGGLAEMDGLVCANDQLAVGALRALREAGLNVPGDISVIGWDDIPEAGFTSPPLTTIAPDVNAIARLAIEVLLRRIADRDAAPALMSAPYRLVERESTRVPGHSENQPSG
nr:LacI family DNA-binding transcriptional regulator [Leucobacter exalbidus]